MASRDVLRVSALHYKDPNKTDEEFEKHFHEVINKEWVGLVLRHNVYKYAVTYSPSAMSAALAETVDKVRPGWSVGTSHAVLTYYVRDMEHMLELVKDPGYQELGRESEAGWIDGSKGEIHIGYEKVYIEDGKIVDPEYKK